MGSAPTSRPSFARLDTPRVSRPKDWAWLTPAGRGGRALGPLASPFNRSLPAPFPAVFPPAQSPEGAPRQTHTPQRRGCGGQRLPGAFRRQSRWSLGISRHPTLARAASRCGPSLRCPSRYGPVRPLPPHSPAACPPSPGLLPPPLSPGEGSKGQARLSSSRGGDRALPVLDRKRGPLDPRTCPRLGTPTRAGPAAQGCLHTRRARSHPGARGGGQGRARDQRAGRHRAGHRAHRQEGHPPPSCPLAHSPAQGAHLLKHHPRPTPHPPHPLTGRNTSFKGSTKACLPLVPPSRAAGGRGRAGAGRPHPPKGGWDSTHHRPARCPHPRGNRVVRMVRAEQAGHYCAGSPPTPQGVHQCLAPKASPLNRCVYPAEGLAPSAADSQDTSQAS